MKEQKQKASLYLILFVSVVITLIVMFVSTFLIYFMGPNSDGRDLERFGQVGDFFGGMLNPALAFASLIALLYTIRIQSEELKLTREEFSKSVKAQEQLVRENRQQQKTAVLSQASQFVANRYLEKITKAQSIFDSGIYDLPSFGSRRFKVIPKLVFDHLVQMKMTFDLDMAEQNLDLAIIEYCQEWNIHDIPLFCILFNKSMHEIEVNVSSAFKCGNELESLSKKMHVEELSRSIHSVSVVDIGWLYGACAFTKEHVREIVFASNHENQLTADLVHHARSFLETCGGQCYD